MNERPSWHESDVFAVAAEVLSELISTERVVGRAFPDASNDAKFLGRVGQLELFGFGEQLFDVLQRYRLARLWRPVEVAPVEIPHR